MQANEALIISTPQEPVAVAAGDEGAGVNIAGVSESRVVAAWVEIPGVGIARIEAAGVEAAGVADRY